jgi:flavin reductase (DIM6/NTAB) family NADH-FMN oxidoreductase RutF
VDKFAQCGLIAEKASQTAAPMIAQSPISLECRVEQIMPLGSHHMFLSSIVAVNVREDLVDEQGLHLDRSGLVAYAHGQYYVLGKSLGKFGFSVKKAESPPKPHRKKHK